MATSDVSTKIMMSGLMVCQSCEKGILRGCGGVGGGFTPQLNVVVFCAASLLPLVKD